MKNRFSQLVSLLILVGGLFVSSVVLADEPPPPPATHGETGDIQGGGAPIGEGLLILSLLGAGYGTKKWREAKQKA